MAEPAPEAEATNDRDSVISEDSDDAPLLSAAPSMGHGSSSGSDYPPSMGGKAAARKGGHNSKRPHACQKKTYEFLAKHLQGARGGVLAAKIDALDDYKAPIRESRPPWAWCAQTAPPPPAAKNLGDAFRSGMTADREKQMGKDISNIFGGGK